MRVDSFGFTHPDEDDPVTAAGMAHVLRCGECRKRFPDWWALLAKLQHTGA